MKKIWIFLFLLIPFVMFGQKTKLTLDSLIVKNAIKMPGGNLFTQFYVELGERGAGDGYIKLANSDNSNWAYIYGDNGGIFHFRSSGQSEDTVASTYDVRAISISAGYWAKSGGLLSPFTATDSLLIKSVITVGNVGVGEGVMRFTSSLHGGYTFLYGDNAVASILHLPSKSSQGEDTLATLKSIRDLSTGSGYWARTGGTLSASTATDTIFARLLTVGENGVGDGFVRFASSSYSGYTYLYGSPDSSAILHLPNRSSQAEDTLATLHDIIASVSGVASLTATGQSTPAIGLSGTTGAIKIRVIKSELDSLASITYIPNTLLLGEAGVGEGILKFYNSGGSGIMWLYGDLNAGNSKVLHLPYVNTSEDTLTTYSLMRTGSIQTVNAASVNSSLLMSTVSKNVTIRVDKTALDSVGILIKGAIGDGFTLIDSVHTFAKVLQIVAGSGVSVSPTNGRGIVTVTATGSSGAGGWSAFSPRVYTTAVNDTVYIRSTTGDSVGTTPALSKIFGGLFVKGDLEIGTTTANFTRLKSLATGVKTIYLPDLGAPDTLAVLSAVRTMLSGSGVSSVDRVGASSGISVGPLTGAVKVRVVKTELDTVAANFVAAQSLKLGINGAGEGYLLLYNTIGSGGIYLYGDVTQNGIIHFGGSAQGEDTVATLYSIRTTILKMSNKTMSSGSVWNGDAITDVYLATISTAGKVSGSAMTSGTIGGSTAITSTGAITLGKGTPTYAKGQVKLYDDGSGKLLTLQTSGAVATDGNVVFSKAGTVAMTSDISYPVTSVFSRTGAVVAAVGDYSAYYSPLVGSSSIVTVGALSSGSINWSGSISTSSFIGATNYISTDTYLNANEDVRADYLRASSAVPAGSTTYGYHAANTIRFKQTAGNETNAGIVSYNEVTPNEMIVSGYGTSSSNRLIRLLDCVGIGGAAPSASYNLNVTAMNLTTLYVGGVATFSGTKTWIDASALEHTVVVSNGIIMTWETN